MLKPRHTDDGKLEAGVDEAGRGCLWGPLVAAAVIWPAEVNWTTEVRTLATQVKDSKKVSAKRRAAMEGQIKAAAVGWGLGVVGADEIDRLGMTKANRLAFQRALEGLVVKPERVVIDGVLGLETGVLHVLGIREQKVEAHGDATYLAIAAASILAKEGRDRMVAEAVDANPVLQSSYGILNSKGYGTAVHRAAIQRHGMLEGHRRLFLRKLLGLDHTVSEGDKTTSYGFIEEEEV
jgi:ribonuclease HII